MSELTLHDIEHLLDSIVANIVERIYRPLEDLHFCLAEQSHLMAELDETLAVHSGILPEHGTALKAIRETQDNHTTMLAVVMQHMKDAQSDHAVQKMAAVARTAIARDRKKPHSRRH